MNGCRSTWVVLAMGAITFGCRPHVNSSRTASAAGPYGLVTRCDNGMATYWAQEAMDADLAEYFLREAGVKASANVAVVDSGLDMSQAADFDVIGGIEGRRGVLPGDVHPTRVPKFRVIESALMPNGPIGDPKRDQNGHGTMVASVIGGRGQQGVAKNIQLRVYRVTTPGGTGSTSDEFLEMATVRACQESVDDGGVAVVNVSWGERLDESALLLDENHPVYRQLLGIYAAKGCLVVKAAGNDNFRGKRVFDIDDPYLRVAAVTNMQDLSYFSSLGEVRAPGSNVHVFESRQMERRGRPEQYCAAKTNRRFVNGTSFAAPLVAGVASQVVRVLKQRGAFQGLTPAARVAIVNRILHASEMGGTVNELRAVHFAEAYAAMTPEERGDVLHGQSYVKLLSGRGMADAAVCRAASTRRCVGAKGGELLSCVNATRTRIALCSNATEDEFIDLIQASFDNDAFEKAYHYARIHESRFPASARIQATRAQMITRYVEKLKSAVKPKKGQEYAGIGAMDSAFIRDVLIPYARQKRTLSSGDIAMMTSLWAELLRSSDVRFTLGFGLDPDTGEDRGSLALLETLRDLVTVSIDAGQSAMVASAVSSWMNALQGDFEFELTLAAKPIFAEQMGSVVAPLRVMDLLLNHPRVSAGDKIRFASVEATLLGWARRFNTYYALRTDSYPLGVEVYPTRSTMYPALARSVGRVVADFRANPSMVSPLEAHFIMDDPKVAGIVDDAGRRELSLRMMEWILAGRGWGTTNDTEIMEQALRATLTMPAAEISAARARFTAAIRDGRNVYMMGRLAQYVGEDRVFGFEWGDLFAQNGRIETLRKQGLTYVRHPLLTSETRALTAAKMLAVLPDPLLSGDDRSPRDASVFASGLGYALAAIVGAPPPAVQVAVASPVVAYPLRSRTETGGARSDNASAYHYGMLIDAAINAPDSKVAADLFAAVQTSLSRYSRPLPYNLNDPIRAEMRAMSPDVPWADKVAALKARWGSSAGSCLLSIEWFLKNLAIVHGRAPESGPTYYGPGG